MWEASCRVPLGEMGHHGFTSHKSLGSSPTAGDVGVIMQAIQLNARCRVPLGEMGHHGFTSHKSLGLSPTAGDVGVIMQATQLNAS
jgi:hypothetical protein